ncbi:MAG: (d)CMP kinase [Bacteroidales bacterium]|nr:(d)CMP kinase [Bacteroidales bacterium]
MKNYIIAIDGFSSCGKSTVAKDLAKKLAIAYVDTGAMYRSVTLYALKHGFITDSKFDEQAIISSLNDIDITFTYEASTGTNTTFLNGQNVEKEIRGIQVSQNVSKVSAIQAVRAKLVDYQRNMGQKTSLVMDGRDIGTVVFPNADLKIFMTARDEVRAQRRYDEMKQKGETVDFETILTNVKERDLIDTTRKESPLRRADDAILLDNSDITKEEQFDFIINELKKRQII